MNPLNWIPGINWVRVCAVLALCVALLAGVWKLKHDWTADGFTAGKAEVQQKWDAEKLAIAAQSAKLLADARKETEDLQASSDLERKTKNEKISKLNSSVADLTERMRNRPSRPTGGAEGVPESASSGVGCTGARLFAEDGAFLVGEAARGDKLRVELESCQVRYDAVRKAVNGP